MIALSTPGQQQERWQQTTEHCRQRLQADANDPYALHQLGLLAREMGELEDAVALIQRSLQADLSNQQGLIDLADTLQQMGRSEDACEFYAEALARAPRDADLHWKMGNALGARSQWDEALKFYTKAVKLNPQSVAALANLGLAQQHTGDLAAAIASLRQAKRLAPQAAQIMANLGGCLVQAGRHEEAIEVLARGLEKHADCGAAFSNLAAAYNAVGRADEAAKAAWQALALDANSVDALNNLGLALKTQGEYAQAINCFAKARQIQPTGYLAYNNLGTTLTEMGRTTEALESLRRALEICPLNPTIFSNYLLTLNYQSSVPRETIFAEHRRFDTLFAEPLRATHEPHPNAAAPHRRLRIGYVSADFREHPIAQFVEPMLKMHTAAEFQIFCYASQQLNDAVTQRLKTYVSHWRNVAQLSDAELAAQIRRDEIDILVDLSGHTAGHRLLTFARKPAPIQVSMIGYMQTTGLSAMDYRVTDHKIDPPGTSEQFSTEKLIRLTHGAATFQPPLDAPAVNELPVARGAGVTFASFNNLAKITPAAIEVWAQILHRLPTAKLVIIGRAGHSLADDFAAHGITPDRLEILARLPLHDYLALHQRVDVLLDTFPYNGGTTNLLAAWMGVPMVTLAGAETASRVGAGLLEALGLPELIANDPADYVQRAVDAVSDLPRLAAWRASLRERLAPLLGNGADFTREFEAALREKWQLWCAQARS